MCAFFVVCFEAVFSLMVSEGSENKARKKNQDYHAIKRYPHPTCFNMSRNMLTPKQREDDFTNQQTN